MNKEVFKKQLGITFQKIPLTKKLTIDGDRIILGNTIYNINDLSSVEELRNKIWDEVKDYGYKALNYLKLFDDFKRCCFEDSLLKNTIKELTSEGFCVAGGTEKKLVYEGKIAIDKIIYEVKSNKGHLVKPIVVEVANDSCIKEFIESEKMGIKMFNFNIERVVSNIHANGKHPNLNPKTSSFCYQYPFKLTTENILRLKKDLGTVCWYNRYNLGVRVEKAFKEVLDRFISINGKTYKSEVLFYVKERC
jgi:hypothetical protein